MTEQEILVWICQHDQFILYILGYIPVNVFASIAQAYEAKMPKFLQFLVHLLAASFINAANVYSPNSKAKLIEKYQRLLAQK